MLSRYGFLDYMVGLTRISRVPMTNNMVLQRHKLVKCCGGKDDKSKKEGSPASSSAHAASVGSSPEDSRRHLG